MQFRIPLTQPFCCIQQQSGGVRAHSMLTKTGPVPNPFRLKNAKRTICKRAECSLHLCNRLYWVSCTSCLYTVHPGPKAYSHSSGALHTGSSAHPTYPPSLLLWSSHTYSRLTERAKRPPKPNLSLLQSDRLAPTPAATNRPPGGAAAGGPGEGRETQ